MTDGETKTWQVETKGGPIKYTASDGQEFDLSYVVQRWMMAHYLNTLEARASQGSQLPAMSALAGVIANERAENRKLKTELEQRTAHAKPLAASQGREAEAVRLLRTPRIEHLLTFPHVKPTTHEQEVLAFLAASDSSGEEVKP